MVALLPGREDHPEPGLAAHHGVEPLGGTLERQHLVHRSDAMEQAELQGVLPRRRQDPGSAARRARAVPSVAGTARGASSPFPESPGVLARIDLIPGLDPCSRREATRWEWVAEARVAAATQV